VTTTDSTRLRVYISSTYQDLVEYRSKAAEAIRKIGYEVVGMETYAASDARPVDKCLADVRACDLYVGIFAWRYGFIPPGYDQSITELEYREATASGRERLIFLARDDTAPDEIDPAVLAQVTRLRGELQLAHVTASFSTPDNLATEVAAAVIHSGRRRLESELQDLRDRQTDADQRQQSRPRQKVVNRPPIDVARFVNRDTERGELRSRLFDDDVRMTKVLGRAGSGKTALASSVLGEVDAELRAASSPSDTRLPDGLVYLGARSTGLSLERLESDARKLLSDEDEERLVEAWKSQDATVEQKAETLLAALSGGRYVILLDAADTIVDADLTIVEPGLRAFVEACLRQSDAPRLVLTSRVDVLVPPEVLGAVRTVRVSHGLDPEHAALLLEQLDPDGELGLRGEDRAVLERAAGVVGGVPRALELLAGILQRDPAANLPELLQDEQALGAQTVESLVAEGYRRLDDDEQRVMEALAVLRRPVPATAVAFLLHPWFPGIDVATCLRRLASGYFVTCERRTGECALQALDREHAYRSITDPPGPRALELRAADFYASIRTPPEDWHALADLAPQLAEFDHCRRAGEIDRALGVLQPIDEQHLALWGHYLLLIELRLSVIDAPARADLRAANVASLGAANQVLGRYDDAVRYYRQAAEIARGAGDGATATTYVGHLGRVYRHLGLLDDAIDCFQQALACAEEAGDQGSIAIWSDRVGYAYSYVGRLQEAIELERRAVAIAEQVGDRRTQAAALSNLGLMHQAEGRLDMAQQHQDDSLPITRAVGDRRGEAIVLGRLGGLALLAGDHALAAQRHVEALAVAEGISDRREQSYQLIGLGRARAGTDPPDLAEGARQLEAARALDVPETSFLAALHLGSVLLRRGDAPGAQQAFEDAAARCRARLDRCDRLFSARYALGTALAGLGASIEAVTEYRQALAICPGAGVLRSTLADLEVLRAAGRADVGPCVELLEAELPAGGS
jgi:tetratricopeptide (TPR) repeat protein